MLNCLSVVDKVANQNKLFVNAIIWWAKNERNPLKNVICSQNGKYFSQFLFVLNLWAIRTRQWNMFKLNLLHLKNYFKHAHICTHQDYEFENYFLRKERNSLNCLNVSQLSSFHFLFSNKMRHFQIICQNSTTLIASLSVRYDKWLQKCTING